MRSAAYGDFDRGLIVLSPARTKNKRQHELPLAPQALAILRRAISAAVATDNSNANGTSTVIETKHHSGNGRANDVGVFGVNGFPLWLQGVARSAGRIGAVMAIT